MAAGEELELLILDVLEQAALSLKLEDQVLLVHDSVQLVLQCLKLALGGLQGQLGVLGRRNRLLGLQELHDVRPALVFIVFLPSRFQLFLQVPLRGRRVQHCAASATLSHAVLGHYEVVLGLPDPDWQLRRVQVVIV